MNENIFCQYPLDKSCKEYKVKKKKPDKLLHEYNFHLIKNCNKEHLVGYVYIKDGQEVWYTEDSIKYLMMEDNCKNDYDNVEEYYEIKENKKSFTKILGYVKIGDEEFIGVCKRFYFIPIVIPIIILSLVFSIQVISREITFKKSPDDIETINQNNNLKIADTVDWNGEYTKPPMSTDDTFTLIGREFYYINKEERCIPLMNSDTNDVYLEYQVYDEDNRICLLESSGLIAPGQSYPFDCYDLVEDGTKIYYIIKCYDLLSYECCAETQLDGISIKKD